MATISVHYWAGAKAAAGVASEDIEARSIAEALAIACARRNDPRFDRILNVFSALVDGGAAHGPQLERPLDRPVAVEILPPFAGGAG